jgi:hypothetical protein
MNRWTFAFALTLAAAAPAEAALRCGNLLIRNGDTQGEVLAKCGEPTEVLERTAPEPTVVWAHGRRYVQHGPDHGRTVTFWVYNFGSSRLMHRLRFEDGVLVHSKTLGYGYEPRGTRM